MKRRAFVLFVAALAALALGCRRQRDPGTLRIGASPVPHAEILEHVKPALAREGIKLEIIEMTDFVQPNVALLEKELDANFFQHQPFLDVFNRERGVRLVGVGKVHVEPLGVYSRKVRALSALGPTSTVAIPNDPVNTARALELLQKVGLLRLNGKKDPTVRDVVADAKTPKLRELEGAQLPRTLDDVDAAVINTNYALEAKLDPARDAIAREDGASVFANLVVTRSEGAADPRIAALVRELNRDTTRRFIEERFRGALVPAF
jgi:D-methionine transport system substrate-binding protein